MGSRQNRWTRDIHLLASTAEWLAAWWKRQYCWGVSAPGALTVTAVARLRVHRVANIAPGVDFASWRFTTAGDSMSVPQCDAHRSALYAIVVAVDKRSAAMPNASRTLTDSPL